MTAITTRIATTDTLSGTTVIIRHSSNRVTSMTTNAPTGNTLLTAGIPENITRQVIEQANIVPRNNSGTSHAAATARTGLAIGTPAIRNGRESAPPTDQTGVAGINGTSACPHPGRVMDKRDMESKHNTRQDNRKSSLDPCF